MMKVIAINFEFSNMVALHLIRVLLETINSGKRIYEESNMWHFSIIINAVIIARYLGD